MIENNYRSSEMAAMLRISPDTVRYYEKLNIISTSRGENNYRILGFDALTNALSVLTLRKAGVSIRQLQEYSLMDKPAEILPYLQEAATGIEEKLMQLQRQEALMRFLIEQFQKIQDVPLEISVMSSPKWYVRRLPHNCTLPEAMNLFHNFEDDCQSICQFVFSGDPDHLDDQELYYTHADDFIISQVPPTKNTEQYQTIESCKCAHMLYIGQYSNLFSAHKTLVQWVHGHHFSVSGNIMEVYLLSNSLMCVYELWAPLKEELQK